MGKAFLRSKRSRAGVGVIYLDFKEAFYRIIRQVAIGGEISDSLLAQVCARFGLPDDVLSDLHRQLCRPSAIEEAQLPKHARNVVKALHVDTFCQVQGQSDFCRTELGPRPGDCYADVIFSYLWGRLLKLLQVELQSLVLGEHVPHETGLQVCTNGGMNSARAGQVCDFWGLTWMDDTCVCLSSGSALELEYKVTHASASTVAV